jgi:hypothetical protein
MAWLATIPVAAEHSPDADSPDGSLFARSDDQRRRAVTSSGRPLHMHDGDVVDRAAARLLAIRRCVLTRGSRTRIRDRAGIGGGHRS